MNAKPVERETNDETAKTWDVNQSVKENYLESKLKEAELLNQKLEEKLKQRTKKLTEVIDAKTRFMTIIAHDLRSPFTAILGSLELLKIKMHDKSAENLGYFVDLALHASNRALNLLDNLLTWTVSQNMAKGFNPEKFNLYDLIDDELDIMNDSALQKNIVLESKISPDMQITADRQMIRTVIRNLINNAIKFTNRGGFVEISACTKEKHVEIMVSDTGIGMSLEVQKNLFHLESFHSTSGTNHETGTGLGLLICKDFIDRHGGFIDIESQPGAGSKFKCIFPSCE